jgi:hypothetical protein
MPVREGMLPGLEKLYIQLQRVGRSPVESRVTKLYDPAKSGFDTHELPSFEDRTANIFPLPEMGLERGQGLAVGLPVHRLPESPKVLLTHPTLEFFEFVHVTLSIENVERRVSSVHGPHLALNSHPSPSGDEALKTNTFGEANAIDPNQRTSSPWRRLNL